MEPLSRDRGPKKADHWSPPPPRQPQPPPPPPKQTTTRTTTSSAKTTRHRRSPASRRRLLALLVLLLSVFLLALTQTPAWPRSSPPPTYGSLPRPPADEFPPDGVENPWAGAQLPDHGPDWPSDRFLLGVGKADITGPVVELNLMGYADPNQVGTGLRQRLYSRAFIVGHQRRPQDRFIYLVLDIQSGDTAIRYGVLRGLAALGPRYAMYGHDNLALTATHSHSGPGAWLNYLLPQMPSLGFDRQSFQAIVDGCLLSIRRAHESLAPGSLSLGTTRLPSAGINRSLYAYLANPAEERARYNISADDDGSVDQLMHLLAFRRASDDKHIGLLTWFPTHGTSMQANNSLVTGDNKGLAADLVEKELGDDSLAVAPGFVAAFSQANMGDVSPNVLGAWCDDDSGEPCRLSDSTCPDGRCNNCRAKGPVFGRQDHGAASCWEIAHRQAVAALDLFRSLSSRPPNVRGPAVKAFHAFHDMAGFRFRLANGSLARTCPAALGYPFGGGTWDEPGGYGLAQHRSTAANSSPFWRLVTWLFKTPSSDQVACQHPKSILLDVGEVSWPYQWTPNLVDIQTLRVGQLIIIVSPGEATTMAGRRWKEAVAAESANLLGPELNGLEPVVVLGAPSNSYTHYITTEEEYGIQRYEGASTLYGPHTLAAHINRSLDSIQYLRHHHPPPRPPRDPHLLPPDNSNRSFSLIPGVLYDLPPLWRRFGEVKKDVGRLYVRGDLVRATFVGANPRNNLRLEQTYAAVEHRPVNPPGAPWRRLRDDSDWNLTFHWRRTSSILGTSEVELVWQIEDAAPAGEYRLRYYGDARSIGGRIDAFQGTSRIFTILDHP